MAEPAPFHTWVKSIVPGRIVGSRLTLVDNTPSTNALALASRNAGAVFAADAQTAGRGRHGNQWHSAPGLGIWFSVALPGPPQGLQFAAVLAVRDALTPLETKVKWPNDLLIQNKKVCGVLVEHRAGWNAIGIGINVSHGPDDFPEDLRASAASIEHLTGKTMDRGKLLAAVVSKLDDWIFLLQRDGHEAVRATWVEACGVVGQQIDRDGVSGTVSGVAGDGALLVDCGGQMRRVSIEPVSGAGELTACCS